MIAFIWTLPIQKLLLLVGLGYLHGRAWRVADLAALAPEILMAVVLTLLSLKWRTRQWLHLGLRGATVLLVSVSWIVIAPWLIVGAPLSYQFVLQLIAEPAVFYSLIVSPMVALQVLVAVAGLLVLWGGVVIFTRAAQKMLTRRPWETTVAVEALFSIALIVFLLPFYKSSFMLPAILALVPGEEMTNIVDSGIRDPSAIAVLKPPPRITQAATASSLKSVKHVLFIILESIRYQPGSLFDTGFLQARHYNRVYAHHPRSVKTLEALLFGIYPSLPQVTATWSIDQYAVDRMAPLPRLLRQQGYETTYYSAMDPAFENYENALTAAGFEDIEAVRGGKRLTWGVNATTLFDRVLETLERGSDAGKPQFIMAWTTECHLPYDYVGERSDGGKPIERYLACQESLARALETLVQRLDGAGRLEDTFVIVLGDHGEIFPEEKTGEWGHGNRVYEPSLRVPLLLFVPGQREGNHDHRLFQPVDLPTTILAALRLPLPAEWVGRNLLDAAEPGRDFVVFLSMLSDGTIGLLDASGMKYVRTPSRDSLLSYDLKQDPYEQLGLPVSAETALAIEKKLATYMTIAAHGWEGKRKEVAVSHRELPGSVIAHWGKGGRCITITPDEVMGMAFVEPLANPGCENNRDPAERFIFRPFVAAPFKAGVRVAVELQIANGEEVRGKRPQAWAKTSTMETPLAVDVQPNPGVWQTVSIVLPGVRESANLSGGPKPDDLLLMFAPVDLPVRFAVRSIVVEPVTGGTQSWLWEWWSWLTG